MGTVILQLCAAAAASAGFSIYFNVRGRKIAVAAVCASLIWGVYLLTYALTADRFSATFAGAALGALLSELLARRMAAPVTVFLVPILIPLFPGGDLYAAASSLVRPDGTFVADFRLVLEEAGAIAAGIVVVACLVQVYYHIRRWYRKQRRNSHV